MAEAKQVILKTFSKWTEMAAAHLVDQLTTFLEVSGSNPVPSGEKKVLQHLMIWKKKFDQKSWWFWAQKKFINKLSMTLCNLGTLSLDEMS